MPQSRSGVRAQHFRRRLATLVVALTLASAGLAGHAAPAQAGVWQFADGFEVNPAAAWSFDGAGTHYGGFGHDFGSPRSGQQLAWANVWSQGGFSSVGRQVRLPRTPSATFGCTARVYLLSASDSLINIEVIDPTTFTYVAFRQVRADINWRAFSVPTWRHGPATVLIRVSVLRGPQVDWDDRMMVDDLAVSCVY
ncbi:MAG TPA: hypothetical protein VES42_27490 [Pilimelia sp.]|nr:hypothetical protein [Pilimelia sp.]